MTSNHDHDNKPTDLRQRAEEILRGKPLELNELSAVEIQRLIYELQVHQVELQLQNEELLQTQRALEESRRTYQDLYDFAPVGYFTLDRDGVVQQVNARAVALLVARHSDLIEKRFLSWVARADGERFRLHLRRLFETHLPQRVELKLIKSSGEQFEAQLESVLVDAGDDVPIHCHTVVLDITERKEAEHQRQLAAIVESSSNPIIGLALDEMITSWNPAAEEMFRYSAKDIIDQPISRLFPGSDAPSFDQQQIAAGGITCEWLAVTADGRSLYVAITASPIHDAGQELAGISLTLRDVTLRRNAEEALRVSEEKYRTLFESIDTGFCIVEVLFDEKQQAVDYRFIEVNPAFEQQTGITNAEGRRMRAIAPLHEARWFEIYGKVALTGEPVRFENRAEQLGRYYDVYAFRVSEPQEHRVAILFNDISERKQSEEAERQQRILAESLRDISYALNSSLQLDEVLALILDNVGRVVPHQVAEILLFENGIARIVGSTGYESRGFQDLIDSLRFPIAETPNLALLASNNQPLVIAEVAAYSGWKDVFRQQWLRSYVGAPIRVRNQVIGCLNLLSSEPGFFSAKHAERLEAFAHQAATALNNAQLYTQAHEVAALKERQGLARDLHDAVSQTLFSASIISEALPRLWDNRPDEVAPQLARLHLLTRSAIAEMRNLLFELRPEDLARIDLKRQLQQMVDMIQGRKPMSVDLQLNGDPALPTDVKVAFYRLAQEAINNILKHSQASQASIVFDNSPASVMLRIEDNGVGFEVTLERPGMGLHSMRERAQAIGATLEVESSPGQGTRVTLIWPKFAQAAV